MATLNYQPATNNLLVFVNGSKQISGTNYQETSSTVITFVDGLNVGDVVDFCTATPINTGATNANEVSYNEGGTGAINRTVTSKLQEWVSVKDFGAVGDGTTNDTVAIAAAINSVNSTAPAQYNLVSLYFPAGKYMVDANTLPAIKGNVYGPDATVEATATSTNNNAILTVDYTSTVGQSFVLRAINGAGNGTLSSYYNAGLVIDGADNSTFTINRLYGLDTGIVLAGVIHNRHIAQCTFNINAIYNCNKGLNLSAGTLQVETNTFNIEYLSTRADNSIGIYLTNTTGYVANNTFNINTIESAGNNIFTIDLAGATPAPVSYTHLTLPTKRIV